MLRRTDIAPGLFETLAVVVAVVFIMIPTCAMVGCTMTGRAMFVPFGDTTSVSAPCGGTYVVSKTPVATGPVSPDASWLLVMAAALAAVFALSAPRAGVVPVRSFFDGPSPPPDDLDGTQLRI